MKNKFMCSIAFFAIAGITITLLSRCGGSSSSTAASVSSLSQLPNASAMLSGTGANGISKSSFRNLIKYLPGINLQSVQGTPPTLISLAASNADTYFWNGLVSTINTAATCSAGNKTKFWGGDTATPGPGGMGACQMASSTGEALGRMLGGTGTLCYMKGITSVSSGVTVTGSTQAAVFTQGSANKTVKIAVTGFNEGRDGASRPQNMDVFFTIHGTDSIGSDKYKYTMYMCQNNAVTSTETLEVTKSTGVLTVTSADSRGSDRGSMSVTAYLKASGSGFTFDPTKSRLADVSYTGSWGTYKGNIEITSSDLVKGKRWFSSGDWGSNKTYSVAAFTGSSVDTFRFAQACTKGISSNAAGNQTWPYNSITEYRNTHYAAVASSDLSAQCDSFTIADDSFFTSNTVSSMDSTGLSCSATTDISVAMDFSNSAVDAIKDTCDGESNKLANYSMCDGNAVRTAESYCRN